MAAPRILRLARLLPRPLRTLAGAASLRHHTGHALAIDTADARELMNMARFRSVDDLLPVAASLIESGRIEVAETLVGALETYHANQWRGSGDAGIPNRFLKWYLQHRQDDKAKRWREWLFQRRLARPDTLTYAILLEHHLDGNNAQACLELVREMAVDGVTVRGVLELDYLSREHRHALLNNVLPAATTKTMGFSQSEAMLSVEGLFDEPFSQQQQQEQEQPAAPTPRPQRNLQEFPLVHSIESKNGGISFIKDSLRVLREDPGADLYAVQERLERDCYQASIQHMCAELAKYRSATKATTFTSDMRRVLAQWQVQLSEHLRASFADISNMEAASSGRVASHSAILYGSMLASLEVEKIALICIQELTRTSAFDLATGGIVMTKLANAVGSALEKEVFAQQIGRRSFLQHAKLHPRVLAKALQGGHKDFATFMRQQYAALERNVEAVRDGWIPQWTPKMRVEIGVYVVSLAVEVLRFAQPDGTAKPAFTHKVLYSNCRSLGVIEPDAEMFRQMSVEDAVVHVDPWSMPMLVPPKPWLTYRNGGYLMQRHVCVRMKDDPLHLALIHAADRLGQLDRVLLGLDALGTTPWLINEKVLRVALELWNGGMNVATLEAPRTSEESTKMEFRRRESFDSSEEYRAYVRKAMERKDQISTDHSTMCDTNYKLEIARQFVGLPFYLPHSVDFRGRAYPIPPHLSHVGSDLSRGLLVFAEGRPLGARGLRWLKIQLANMAGFDKASLDERAAYAEEHMADVLDSADNPIHGRRWWRRADEPWQCLATCMELAAALRSANPEEFISHVPCQQDGSCNGLQHYAALGGDMDGARQVNLAPAERPQDVYAAVARLVNAQIERDCAADPKHIAHKLRGKINRKIIKQPVMTNVYGVTMYGAREQIKERLREFKVVEPNDYLQASIYLAQAVFNSLGTLFDGAQKIQKWLTDTAVEIARAIPKEVAAKFGTAVPRGGGTADADEKSTRMDDPADRYPQTSVYWTTPLGFPVLQPYVKSKKVSLKTVLQNVSLRLTSKFDPVDVAKQASAFPPNFVHSLDATHMFLTALACREAGVTFASVHDCFWTHAATVDDMSRLLREQFVALHSQGILEGLRTEFVGRYRDYVVPDLPKNAVPCGDIRHMRVAKWRPLTIPPLPPRGGFDIPQVLQSEYFFS